MSSSTPSPTRCTPARRPFALSTPAHPVFLSPKCKKLRNEPARYMKRNDRPGKVLSANTVFLRPWPPNRTPGSPKTPRTNLAQPAPLSTEKNLKRERRKTIALSPIWSKVVETPPGGNSVWEIVRYASPEVSCEESCSDEGRKEREGRKESRSKESSSKESSGKEGRRKESSGEESPAVCPQKGRPQKGCGKEGRQKSPGQKSSNQEGAPGKESPRPGAPAARGNHPARRTHAPGRFLRPPKTRSGPPSPAAPPSARNSPPAQTRSTGPSKTSANAPHPPPVAADRRRCPLRPGSPPRRRHRRPPR